MAARILPVVKLATKVTIAGGAVYVACDSGLLGNSEQGSKALEKAKEVIPPAIQEWMKYFGLEAQLPTMPKIEFSPVQAWNLECGGQFQIFRRLQRKHLNTQIRDYST
ncbi:MICOS complex subunit MIC13-like [Mugil cephalus]|uniref:MICOS complex subunit MIC13-like n=1 Tax=Mugil cephalus TaxID=48193 RepID=UPI001FB58512|nr:MICOS complex subunit MIC13-like [Mugil cephalus]